MRRKGFLAFMIVTTMLPILTSVSESQSGHVDELVPYVPSPGLVDLEFWMKDPIAYVNVTLYLTCCNVASWGEVTKDGYILWVNSEIWQWAGPCTDVVVTWLHTYNLGPLRKGNYNFTLMAWDVRVKSINFTIVRDPPVGGIWVPVDKFELLAPYIGLTILLAVAVTTVAYVKKRKRYRD